jgi:hypothetical protein
MTHSRVIRVVAAVLLPLSVASLPALVARSAQTPAQVAQSLLDADRHYAAASGDMLTAYDAMFADGVVMPGGPTGLVVGKAAVLNVLRAQPDAATSRATWTPQRAGVSADGEHGFTFGFLTLSKADGTRVPMKYMTYWVREDGVWHALAYKRGRAASAPTDSAMMAPALPRAMWSATRSATRARTRDVATLTRLRHELMAREGEFSSTAQRIGLGNAFVEFGSADAVNMGGPATAQYVVSANAIAAQVGGGDMKSSPVHWGADTAFVASSGDLGITFGVIRANTVPAGGDPNAGSAFFTIWRRADSRSPWKYVAE